MDRTADFRRFVAGLGGPSATAAEPAASSPSSSSSSSPFMGEARELRGRLGELRRALLRDGSGEASEIHAFKASVSELEPLALDLSDLADRAPPHRRRQDLINFRRAVVRDLYEELRDLASQVQTEQMQEMRHENEVASFFTAAPSSSSRAALAPGRKPPPLLAGSSAQGVEADLVVDALVDESVSAESLKAEEQQLLAAFETNLDQINQVKQKLGEVAAMVSVFATKAEEQQEIAENILEDAQTSTTNVEEAGKHLQRANDNKSSYNFYIVCWFTGSAIFLLIFDFIDARYSWI
mmetsp:Transcript_25662/g.82898  ORF Transcript_25662/g.82898 Transcript_25662/m.82898 type:complete len:295 (-) Transcript_25662:34-918(-)